MVDNFQQYIGRAIRLRDERIAILTAERDAANATIERLVKALEKIKDQDNMGGCIDGYRDALGTVKDVAAEALAAHPPVTGEQENKQ